jgi:hypothetical protein
MAPVAYYIPLNKDFTDGKPVLIDLNHDGSANLSRLPVELRETFEFFGFPDIFHQETIFPKDGKRFIASLLVSRSPILRFCSSLEEGS